MDKQSSGNGGKIQVPNGQIDTVTGSVELKNGSIVNFRNGDENVLTLNGHDISYSDGFMSFECENCDESFEVPEIFQASTNFNKVIYQLYIISHFKEYECPEATDLYGVLRDEDEYGSPPSGAAPAPAIQDIHWASDDVTITTDNSSYSADGIADAARSALRRNKTKRFK